MKSAVSCGFVHIYWINPQWKTSFFVLWPSWKVTDDGHEDYAVPSNQPILSHQEPKGDFIRELVKNSSFLQQSSGTTF